MGILDEIPPLLSDHFFGVFFVITISIYTTVPGRIRLGSWADPSRIRHGSVTRADGETPAHENTTRTLRYRSREKCHKFDFSTNCLL